MNNGRPIVDLVGKKFERLTCIKFDHQGNGELAFFEFLCDCGNKRVLCGTEVSHGRVKSCGCYRKGHCGSPKAPGEAAFNSLYKSYITCCAKNRGLNFTLSKEEFATLTKGNCEYCGIEPLQVFTGTSKKSTPYLYNGVDRLDNKLGYTKENCVSCCKICNIAKHALTLEEFMSWIRRLVKFQQPESDAKSIGRN